MYQGIITLPKCGICSQMMLGGLVVLIDCGDTIHNQCFEQFRLTKKCPICQRKVRDFKQIIYYAEQHHDLNNKSIIPLCVNQKFQQYEAEIQQLNQEIRELQKESEELDKQIEFQKKLNALGPFKLFEQFQGTITRIKECELTIEELKNKSKAAKQLEEQDKQLNSEILPLRYQNPEEEEK